MTSTMDSIYKKMAPPLDGGTGHSHESVVQFDPAKHVSPLVAHELNNILTIVQGYADRLIIKYPNDSTLQPQLKLISEAARRAAIIIRDATPNILQAPPQIHPDEPEPTAA